MRLCNNAIFALLFAAAVVPSLAAQLAAKPSVTIPVYVTNKSSLAALGLQRESFEILDEGLKQQVVSFEQDAPMSVGILLDLSGSMTSKLAHAREAILQFIRAANPKDEFFIVGFSDKPELVEDFTNSFSEVQSRLASVTTGHRTALLDAIHFGAVKMEGAHHERKVLLLISDGGDNASRYFENQVNAQVRESGAEFDSIGIFDLYAATPEERFGPLIVGDLCEKTGGQSIRVSDLSQLIREAASLSTELRYQYILGYTPSDLRHDGKWRKVKIKLNLPPGSPSLVVHSRTGYYAPLQ